MIKWFKKLFVDNCAGLNNRFCLRTTKVLVPSDCGYHVKKLEAFHFHRKLRQVGKNHSYHEESLMWGPAMGTLLRRCISSREYILRMLSWEAENTQRLSTDRATVESASRCT